MQDLSTYVVTGATRGIGRAVATALAASGFHVVAVGRSRDLLASLKREIGAQVTTVQADLATPDGVLRLVDSVANDSGITGIVHSAGSLVPLQTYTELDPVELVAHLQIHVAAPIEIFQALSKQQPVKRLLFIDSYSATAARNGWAAYSIVKAAAQMAARCAAQELPDTRVIRVFPGAVNTRIVDEVLASNTETAATFATMLEKGEFAEPNEVAPFIVNLLTHATDEFLLSQDAFDYNNEADRTNVMAAG